MSVVVAVKKDGAVYMGADSQTSAGERRFHYLNETGYKITRFESGILVGCCGEVSASQIVLSTPNLFTLSDNGTLTKKHIVTNIVPKMFEIYTEIEKISKGKTENTFLVAYKDKLYCIDSRLLVTNYSDFVAIGAGQNYAVYHLSNGNLSPKTRVVSALKESAKRCDSVGAPFVLIDTKNLEFEIVGEGGNDLWLWQLKTLIK